MKAKLCAFANHTFAVLDYNIEHIFTVKENRRLVGGLGSCLDSMLCPLAKRKCHIIGKDVFAEKYENGTYSESTGVLGLLKSNSIDLYLKGESQNIDLTWLRRTKPFKIEGFYIGHRIFKTNNLSQYVDVVRNLNIGLEFVLYFIAFLVLSLVLCFSVVKLTNKMKDKQIKFQSILFNQILSNRPLRLSSIGLLLYALNLFLNFCQLFVLNEIQADKILVDTSELIKNDDDILGTKKVACLVKSEVETNIFGKNSIIHQVIEQKMKFSKEQTMESSIFEDYGGKCLLKKTTPLQLLYDSQIYFIGTQIFELSLYYAFALIGLNFKGWRYSKPVHETNNVLYYTMKNPDNDQFAKDVANFLTESGVSQRLDECTRFNTLVSTRKTVTVFKTIQEFVDDNVGFDDLVFENFQVLFVAYFSFCVLILIVWLTWRAWKRIPRLRNFRL